MIEWSLRIALCILTWVCKGIWDEFTKERRFKKASQAYQSIYKNK